MNKQLKPKVYLPIILGFILFVLLALRFQEPIKDWWFFVHYDPTLQIEKLSIDSGMGEDGEFLFQRTDPELVGQEVMDVECGSAYNIGCFITGPKIYILDYERFKDATYNQAVVTSAHEMLHHAYFRLDKSEREKVDQLIEDEIPNITDIEVKTRILGYEAEARRDEAHSIVATEVGLLSPDLEQYYSQYFSNRQKTYQAFEASRELIR